MNDQPLRGLRVVVTRAEAQAADFVERLETLGAEVVAFPTIAIAAPADTAPLDRALSQLAAYDWVIFTSANGVEHFWLRTVATNVEPTTLRECKVAAIGPATADALRTRGIEPDLVPDEYIAEAVSEALSDVAGLRILLPQADIARQMLHEALVARGARVDEVVTYRTVPFRPLEAAFDALQTGADILTFTSPSTVRNFVEFIGDALAAVISGATISCIGPITAQAARELGLPVHLVAEDYTIEGLIEAILNATAKTSPVV